MTTMHPRLQTKLKQSKEMETIKRCISIDYRPDNKNLQNVNYEITKVEDKRNGARQSSYY